MQLLKILKIFYKSLAFPKKLRGPPIEKHCVSLLNRRERQCQLSKDKNCPTTIFSARKHLTKLIKM